MQPAYLMENPVKLAQKSKNSQKAKGTSFAFLFSVIIYISIFYIFRLSPSTLLSNTMFWFVISNTLILIIAADYSSSKDQKRDLYEEFSLQSQARKRNSFAAAAGSQYPKIVKKISNPEQEDVGLKETKNGEMGNERILEVVKFEPKIDHFQTNIQQEQEHPNIEADKTFCEHYDQIKKKVVKPKTIRRSKSENPKHVTFQDKKNKLQRSKTEKHEPISTAKETEDNNIPNDDDTEFSNMSNEELNRRVEEFIQKFNREIRRQGAENRPLLEFE